MSWAVDVFSYQTVVGCFLIKPDPESTDQHPSAASRPALRLAPLAGRREPLPPPMPLWGQWGTGAVSSHPFKVRYIQNWCQVFSGQAVAIRHVPLGYFRQARCCLT